MYRNQQYALAVKKSNFILGCIKTSVVRGIREVILSLSSALIKSHLKYCVQFCRPKHRTFVDLLCPESDHEDNQRAGESLLWQWAKRVGHCSRDNGFKLTEGRLVRHWNGFPREIVDTPFLAVLRAQLNEVPSNLM